MRIRRFILFLAVAIIAITSVATIVAQSHLAASNGPWRKFAIILPEEVAVNPGDIAIIDGGVQNNGIWWLHDFNITVSGLPEGYTYDITPQHWDDLRILWEWNSDVGVYREPEKFKLTINVPANAYGLHLVTLKGQEFYSFYQQANESYFVLKVKTQANFTLSDIVVPEIVVTGKPFNISLNAINLGPGTGSIKLTVDIPEGWNVDEKTKTVEVESNKSKSVIFTITPTNKSGQISVLAEYPFQAAILNITKVGPTLIPQTEGVTTAITTTTTPTTTITTPTTPTTIIPAVATTTTAPPEGWTADVTAFIVKAYNRIAAIPWWILAIAIILIIIIVWNLYSIFKRYKFKIVRGKEEKFVEPENISEKI
jgi:hypothetical protein